METQLTIRVPSKLSSAVGRIAKSMSLKRSDIVRLALKNFVEQEAPVKKQKTLYEKVGSLVGSVRIEIPDLAENHRKYLLQKIKHE